MTKSKFEGLGSILHFDLNSKKGWKGFDRELEKKTVIAHPLPTPNSQLCWIGVYSCCSHTIAGKIYPLFTILFYLQLPSQ
jgi:hypothetical protein